MKSSKKVIFIGGTSYSGSTMLDMMVANSPEGFSAGEVHALFRPYRPHHFSAECGCGASECDFWPQVRAAGEAQLYQTIFKMLPDVSYIVDSSKNPWWIKKQEKNLKAQGIEVYHLLIWKDPAAFAYSMIKRKRKGWERSWINYHRLYFSLIKNYLPIAYSQLTLHPEKQLRIICRKTGLTYHEGQEKFWQKQHHTLFGNITAKVHLHEDNEARSDSYGRQFIYHEDEKRHRTIYCDTAYAKSLPTSVKKTIEDKPEFKNIIAVLNAPDKGHDTKGISLSSGQLLLFRAKSILKAFMGKTIGRYWRIF